MKNIFILLALLSFNCQAQYGLWFSVWSISKDTANAGDAIYFTAKFGDDYGIKVTDTLELQNDGFGAPVFKMALSEAILLPTNPDGTTTLMFTMPILSKGQWHHVYSNSVRNQSNDSIYVPANITTNTLLPTDYQKKGTVYYYSNTGILIKEAPTGIIPGLSGSFVYRIVYEDNSITTGHVYFN